MTETKRRIRALKKQLPAVKGKVAAMAVSLLLAVTMLTSVSFAWFTMSGSPELGGIKTTISANGNLEIALSDKDGLPPDSSGIGDSFSAEGQDIHLANTSWGNLINLSSIYGIENLILRPSKLEAGSSVWLSGVKYSEDGRYESAAKDYGFTAWETDEYGKEGFLVPKGDAFGVRAISSVGFEKGSGRDPLQAALEIANNKNRAAATQFESMMNAKTTAGANNMAVVNNLVGAFVSAKLSDAEGDFGDDLDEIINLMKDLETVIDTYGSALVDLARLQQRAYCEKNSIQYVPYTLETLRNATAAQLKANGVVLATLQDYKNIKAKMETHIAKLNGYVDLSVQGTAIGWSKLQPIVEDLIQLSTTTIGGVKIYSLSMDNIGEAIGLLGGGTKDVVIYGGIMHKIEELTGARMKNVQPTVKVKVIVTVTGVMQTDLSQDIKATYYRDEETTKTQAEISEFKGNMIAQDTYGMVLDLWVRTNSADSYLTLDGLLDLKVYYEQWIEYVPVGNESQAVPLWVYTYKTGEVIAGEELTEDIIVYVIPQNLEDSTKPPREYNIQIPVDEETSKEGKISEGVFYTKETHTEVMRRDANGNITDIPIDHTDVKPYMEEKHEVLGFQGSNRVDNDWTSDTAGEVSATQGTGSCYIFYANTPEEAESAKRLLANLKLAFIDVNNSVLATGSLDVAHILEEGGKYIVPIYLDDQYGVEVRGTRCIAKLTQNVPTRISVLVYLDGTALENSMVMSKDSILGSLNIQFSSVQQNPVSQKPLWPMGNEELEGQTISLNAQLLGATEHEYDGTVKTTEIKAVITGMTPNKVLAYFQRQVNASQGSRMEPVELRDYVDENGVTCWGAEAPFKTPGTYVLRSLMIDGVEYALPEALTVTVSGLQIKNISMSEEMELTANRYVNREVKVEIQADEATRPENVTLRALAKDSGEYVVINMKFDPNSIDEAHPYGLWKGEMQVTSSDTYTLTYIVMDGEYTELSTSHQKSFTAYMGLRARVVLTREGGLTFKYTSPQEVRVRLDIVSDSGDIMRLQDKVDLYYNRRGATTLANYFHSELSWNSGEYTGTMLVDDIGTFVFYQLAVGDNLITVAESAPVIMAQPIDPPSYESGSLYKEDEGVVEPYGDSNYVVMEDEKPLFFKVSLKNAATAYKLVLIMKDYNNQEYEVTIENDVGIDGISYVEDGVYYFAIPKNMAGNRNGQWTITQLRLYGVYDNEGNYFGEVEEDNPALKPYKEYYTLAAETEFYMIDVFTTSIGNTITLGMENGNIVKGFMEAQTVGDKIQVGIDFAGMELPAGVQIQNVQLILEHQQSSSLANGGYSYENSKHKVTTLTLNKIGTKYVTGADTTVYLAGKYMATLKFTLTGASLGAIEFTETFSGKTVLDVYSKAPKVEITKAAQKATISSDKKTAEVHSVTSEGTCGAVNYTPAEVTITLTGIGKATNATMTFAKSGGGTVLLFEQGASGTSSKGEKTGFEWSADGGCRRCVGKYTYNNLGSDGWTAAGTLISNQLELSFENETYTVDVTITINNPD